MTLEGDTGSLSDVGELGDEWAFTLYDIQGEELLCFAFETEQTARTQNDVARRHRGDGDSLYDGISPNELRGSCNRLNERADRFPPLLSRN